MLKANYFGMKDQPSRLCLGIENYLLIPRFGPYSKVTVSASGLWKYKIRNWFCGKRKVGEQRIK